MKKKSKSPSTLALARNSIDNKSTKEKVNKLNLFKNLNFCIFKKDTIERVKTDRENYKQTIYLIRINYPEHIKKFYPTVQSQTTHFNRQKTNTVNFSKEDSQISNNHIKRGSTSLFTRKIQIKTTP